MYVGKTTNPLRMYRWDVTNDLHAQGKHVSCQRKRGNTFRFVSITNNIKKRCWGINTLYKPEVGRHTLPKVKVHQDHEDTYQFTRRGCM